jgi:uncharacterized protein
MSCLWIKERKVYKVLISKYEIKISGLNTTKMKIYFKFLSVLFLINILLTNIFGGLLNHDKNDDYIGTWLGKLKIQTGEIRIVFGIEKKDEKLSAYLDSPDQGNLNIPVDDVTITKDSLSLILSSIGVRYEGKIQRDSLKIVGVWKQNGEELPLEIKKIETVVMEKKPQEPAPPFPYNSENVIFENKGIKLVGTLTYPKDNLHFAAVILISDFGPQDRDETSFNHKPFLTISDYLTRNGLAVLRYDDRGIGGSTGRMDKATTLDFAEDVDAAIKYLKSRKEIDSTKIGLIGHSEGGLIASIIAARSKDIAFIVLLAGIGLPGDKLLPLQIKQISESEGEQPEKVKKNFILNKKLFSLAKTETDSISLKKKIAKVLTDYYNSLKEEDKKQIYDLNLFIDQQFQTLSGTWIKFFLQYDPRKDLEKVTCPVLTLNGAKDVQVPFKENLIEIRKALEKGHNKNIKIIEIQGLNHFFQSAISGRISEYKQLDDTFALKALEIIYNWINDTIKIKDGVN